MISTLQEMNDRINKIKIRVEVKFDDGMRYSCPHYSQWQTEKYCPFCEAEEKQMNKEMQEKIANWKAANSIDGFCSILGLTLEEMAEAAEMWKKWKALLATETRWPDKGQVVWEERDNKFRFDTVKDWFEWIINRHFVLAGRLTVGDFKSDEDIKIRMPPDWDKKDDRLTRQEAIDVYKKYFKYTPTNQIDFYVALGMLKLKEEKPVTNKLDDDLVLIEAENVTRVHSFGEVSPDNVRRLIDLVSKLLNIIKRGKS